VNGELLHQELLPLNAGSNRFILPRTLASGIAILELKRSTGISHMRWIH
jgi:hypothetical protein